MTIEPRVECGSGPDVVPQVSDVAAAGILVFQFDGPRSVGAVGEEGVQVACRGPVRPRSPQGVSPVPLRRPQRLGRGPSHGQHRSLGQIWGVAPHRPPSRRRVPVARGRRPFTPVGAARVHRPASALPRRGQRGTPVSRREWANSAGLFRSARNRRRLVRAVVGDHAGRERPRRRGEHVRRP